MQDHPRFIHEPETPAAAYCPDSGAYEIDERLDDLVDLVVVARQEHGDSLDDAVDAVTSLIRTVAPTDAADSGDDWEARWRGYFAFSDHAIMRAIRTYVERANVM